jgi:hypothetical protein
MSKYWRELKIFADQSVYGFLAIMPGKLIIPANYSHGSAF